MPRYIPIFDHLEDHPPGTLHVTAFPADVFDKDGKLIDLFIMWFNTDTGEICHQVRGKRDDGGMDIWIDDDEGELIKITEKFPAPLSFAQVNRPLKSSALHHRSIDERNPGPYEVTLNDGRIAVVTKGGVTIKEVKLPRGGYF